MSRNKKLFLRLALVIILAASLLAPMAVGPAPAAAVTPSVAPPTVSPTTAGSVAQYTITGTTVGAWILPGAPGTVVTVAFPAGTTVPAAYAAGAITINGAAVAAGDAAGAGTSVAITIRAATAVAAATPFTIVFTAGAGIKNPPAGAGLVLTVAKALDSGSAAEAAAAYPGYTITAAVNGLAKLSLSTLNASNAETAAAGGLPMWIAGTGFSPLETLTFNSTGGALTITTQYAAVQSANLGVGTAATLLTATADAGGNVVVAGNVAYAGAAAATITINASGNTSGNGAAAALTVTAAGVSVAQQVKITSGLVVAYADQLNQANLASFAHVGDAFTVAAANTGCVNPGCALAPSPATFGDFTAGGAMTVIFDGTAQPLLGSTTVDATVSSGGNANPNYRTFTTTVIVPLDTGGSLVTSAGNFPGSSKTVKVTDGVYAIIFNFYIAPKATFSPNVGGQGATVTVTGTGFAKAKGITLYSSPIVATTVALGTAVSSGTITTDATGSFSGTFAALANTKYISVVDGNGTIALNIFRADSSGGTFVAKPSLSISPNSGKAGDTITVTGSNFAAGANLEVFFGTQPATYVLPLPAIVVVGTGLVAGNPVITTDANGNIPAGVTFVVPAVVQGSYQVYAIDTTNKNQNVAFTVGALTLTEIPTASPRYGKVTMTVQGMTGGGAIPPGNVIVGGVAWNVAGKLADSAGVSLIAPIGQITLDASGNATFTMRVPNTVNYGSQVLQITDAVGLLAQGTLTISQPTITLTPNSATANSTVAVTGKGWVPNQTVIVTAAVAGLTNATATGQPDGSGAFAATFTVPNSWGAGATATVTANDGATAGNTSVTTTFSVPNASITVTPATAKWGDTVTVAGTGFAGGSVIQARIPWNPAGAGSVFPNTVYSDSAGNFSATFVMPTITTGVQSIGAVDNSGTNATATITVTAAPQSVASALATISTQLIRVWGFDAPTQTYQLYDPAVPAALNTLAGLTKGQGYFIYVSAATSIITGSGNLVPLAAGWNLIGW